MFVCVEDLQRSEWNSQIFPRLWKSSQLIQVFWCVCFIVGILCVWDQWCFVAVRKMSRSYPDPTFKIYCVSARLGEFLMESTPQQQFSARHKPLKSPAWQACRRAKSEPSRSLFEDWHLKASFCWKSMQGQGTEPNHTCVPQFHTSQQDLLTCLMRAAACRRFLRLATSSWSCCHNVWSLSLCFWMFSSCVGFFWLRSQPLLITSAQMALCELHSASRA